MTRKGCCRLVKKNECVFCEIELMFDKEKGFYWCPDCGGEWWPGPSDYDINTIWKDEQQLKRRMSKPGSGNKQSRRKKKEKQTKGLASERFKLE